MDDTKNSGDKHLHIALTEQGQHPQPTSVQPALVWQDREGRDGVSGRPVNRRAPSQSLGTCNLRSQERGNGAVQCEGLVLGAAGLEWSVSWEPLDRVLYQGTMAGKRQDPVLGRDKARRGHTGRAGEPGACRGRALVLNTSQQSRKWSC